MTVTHFFSLLFLIGLGYAVFHLLDTIVRRRVLALSGENGILEHVAVGDVRSAANDLLMAVLFLVIAVLPLLVPVIGIQWFSLLQQTAFILLGSVFVIGMAFARLHEHRRP